jgi:hypothetical protein
MALRRRASIRGPPRLPAGHHPFQSLRKMDLSSNSISILTLFVNLALLLENMLMSVVLDRTVRKHQCSADEPKHEKEGQMVTINTIVTKNLRVTWSSGDAHLRDLHQKYPWYCWMDSQSCG